ncbi:MAG: hypothetical protein ACSHWZ_08830 [Sulfitobacter sp.]
MTASDLARIALGKPDAHASALASLARGKRKDCVTWVSGGVEAEDTAGHFAQLLAISAEPAEIKDDLARQIRALCQAPALQPFGVVLSQYTGPLKAAVAASAGDVSNPRQLWIATLDPQGWNKAAEQNRLTLLAEISTPQSDSRALMEKLQSRMGAEPIATMDILRREVSEIFSASGVPLGQRMTMLLEAACLMMGMDGGIITRQSGEGFLINHASHAGLKMVPSAPNPSLSDVVAAQPEPVCEGDLLRSHLGNMQSLLGDRPGAYFGQRIMFDGQVQGTMEFFAKDPRPGGFQDWERLVLSTLSLYAAPYAYLME